MDDAAAGGGEVHGDTRARREGEEKTMKVARAIAGMASGAGEFSYTRNSSLQSQSLNILKPILEQEIMELEFLKDCSGSAIRMADFGCSLGANTLGYAEICYQSVCRARLRNGRKFPDEVQYFFCDLPSNDFNTLFLQLEDWRKTQTSMEDFCVAAVPGSFHRRLFPKGSLHVAISTFAVLWMSQNWHQLLNLVSGRILPRELLAIVENPALIVRECIGEGTFCTKARPARLTFTLAPVPDVVLNKSSPAYNKGRVWTDDNKNVATVQAFTQTARQDLRNFLLSRANEVIQGGLVFFHSLGRADGSHPEIQWPKEGEYVGPYSKVFEATWEELVIEGIIEEERRDTFNVPVYVYSVDDVKLVVESTNAFHIKLCEVKRQSYFLSNEVEEILANPKAYGQFTKKFTRSLVNSIMVEHIGEEKCHVFFERLEKNAIVAAQEKRMASLPLDCILAILIRK